MTLPYSHSTSGRSAIEDIRKIIINFGCSKFSPMEDFVAGTVSVQFEYRETMVQITASAKGYAAAWIRENPHTKGMKSTIAEYEKKALQKGQIAVWSILRDWIKGQMTAIEIGLLSFQGAFLGQIMLPSGVTVLEEVESRGLLLLGKPEK